MVPSSSEIDCPVLYQEKKQASNKLIVSDRLPLHPINNIDCALLDLLYHTIVPPNSRRHDLLNVLPSIRRYERASIIYVHDHHM